MGSKISAPRDITGMEAVGGFIMSSILSIILLIWTLTNVNKVTCPSSADNSVCEAIYASLETIRIPCALHISLALLLLLFSSIFAVIMRKRAKDNMSEYAHVDKTLYNDNGENEFE